MSCRGLVLLLLSLGNRLLHGFFALLFDFVKKGLIQENLTSILAENKPEEYLCPSSRPALF